MMAASDTKTDSVPEDTSKIKTDLANASGAQRIGRHARDLDIHRIARCKGRMQRTGGFRLHPDHAAMAIKPRHGPSQQPTAAHGD